jgi:hypothetical protein
MPNLYLDTGKRVIGISAPAAEELRGRLARRAKRDDRLARLFETPGPVRTATLSEADRETLERILEEWIEEVGIDQLWPALRELHRALSPDCADTVDPGDPNARAGDL